MVVKENNGENISKMVQHTEQILQDKKSEIQSEVHKIPKKSRKKLVIGGIIVLIVALVLGGLIYRKMAGTPEARAKAETVKLVKEVKKLMILPDTDVPAIFDVQDPTLLASQQAFFVGAEKGDKLLVYPQIGKAIIYSPSRHIIVNVGPVTFDQAKGTPKPVSTTPAAAVPTATPAQ